MSEIRYLSSSEALVAILVPLTSDLNGWGTRTVTAAVVRLDASLADAVAGAHRLCVAHPGVAEIRVPVSLTLLGEDFVVRGPAPGRPEEPPMEVLEELLDRLEEQDGGIVLEPGWADWLLSAEGVTGIDGEAVAIDRWDGPRLVAYDKHSGETFSSPGIAALARWSVPQTG